MTIRPRKWGTAPIAVLSVLVLVTACSGSDNALPTAETGSTAATATATAAVTTEEEPEVNYTQWEDHGHDRDGQGHDEADDHGHGSEDEDRHEAVGSALTEAGLHWYEVYCDGVGAIVLQGGPEYTAESTEDERADAHKVWLEGVIERATTARTAISEVVPSETINGDIIQYETLTALDGLIEGAQISAKTFETRADAEGVAWGEADWEEIALRPYAEASELLHLVLDIYAEQLLPSHLKEQILPVGVCGELLDVHGH